MRRAAILLLGMMAAPLLAKDRLGAYQGWAAFKDPEIPRCYAIGSPDQSSGSGGYLSVGFWPKQGLSHQLYVRLSKPRGGNAAVTLSVGGRRFQLVADGNAARARDRTMDLAIIVAIRSAQSLSVQSSSPTGNIIDAYALRGAASAIDAAALGCAIK